DLASFGAISLHDPSLRKRANSIGNQADVSIQPYACRRARRPAMEPAITNLITALLLPPGIVLVVLLAGLAVMRRAPLGARWLVLPSWLALYVLSTPYVGPLLLDLLQSEPLDSASDNSGEAIVVLGGGTYFEAPEYGSDTVNPLTLVRLRYAAHLYRTLG